MLFPLLFKAGAGGPWCFAVTVAFVGVRVGCTGVTGEGGSLALSFGSVFVPTSPHWEVILAIAGAAVVGTFEVDFVRFC